MPSYKNEKCPVCNQEFKDGDDIVTCPVCGTQGSWNRNCIVWEAKSRLP